MSKKILALIGSAVAITTLVTVIGCASPTNAGSGQSAAPVTVTNTVISTESVPTTKVKMVYVTVPKIVPVTKTVTKTQKVETANKYCTQALALADQISYNYQQAGLMMIQSMKDYAIGDIETSTADLNQAHSEYLNPITNDLQPKYLAAKAFCKAGSEG
jgi:hypothetical protein